MKKILFSVLALSLTSIAHAQVVVPQLTAPYVNSSISNEDNWRLTAMGVNDYLETKFPKGSVFSLQNNDKSVFGIQFNELLSNEIVNGGKYHLNVNGIGNVITYSVEPILFDNTNQVVLHLKIINSKTGFVTGSYSKTFSIQNNDLKLYTIQNHKTFGVISDTPNKPTCKQILTPDFYGDGIQLSCVK